MIIILKEQAPQDKLDSLLSELKTQGLDTHPIVGEHQTIIGLIGNTTRIDIGALQQHEIVADVRRVSEPYKLVNRKFHEDDTIVSVPGAKWAAATSASSPAPAPSSPRSRSSPRRCA